MPPTTFPCHLSTVGFRRRKLPRTPAHKAKTAVLTRPNTTKTIHNKDNSQEGQLKHHRSVFRPHELGKECEEKKRRLRVQHLCQNGLPEGPGGREREVGGGDHRGR